MVWEPLVNLYFYTETNKKKLKNEKEYEIDVTVQRNDKLNECLLKILEEYHDTNKRIKNRKRNNTKYVNDKRNGKERKK